MPHASFAILLQMSAGILVGQRLIRCDMRALCAVSPHFPRSASFESSRPPKCLSPEYRLSWRAELQHIACIRCFKAARITTIKYLMLLPDSIWLLQRE